MWIPQRYSLQEYIDIDSEIRNYNLEDNMVQALVKEIAGPEKVGSFDIKHKYDAYTVPGLLEESVIPDLKKLEVKGYKLTPSFSANVYEYKLNIKQDVDELEIITEKQNDKVSIEVVGNTDLKERRKYNYYFSKK